MRSHLLYIIIGVLLAGNVALLLKKTPIPPAMPRSSEGHELPEKVVVLDSLIIRRWSDNAVIQPQFAKPTFVFFFSRANCSSCVEKAIDFLTSHASSAVETLVVSVDIYDQAEKQGYDARFLRSLPFYALQAVHRTPEFDVRLPVLMVVNTRREILFVKQILPSDNLQGDYLFWRRINFLYTLLDL